MRLSDDVTCAELVELVTEYFEGALSPELVERFEEHLVICDGCSTHVQQMRDTIRVAGALPETDLEAELSVRLLSLFRSWSETAA